MATEDLMEWLEMKIGDEPDIIWDKQEFHNWAQKQIQDLINRRKTKKGALRDNFGLIKHEDDWVDALRENHPIDIEGEVDDLINGLNSDFSVVVNLQDKSPDELKTLILEKILKNRSAAEKLASSSHFALRNTLNSVLGKLQDAIKNNNLNATKIESIADELIAEINSMPDDEFDIVKKKYKDNIVKNRLERIGQIEVSPALEKIVDEEVKDIKSLIEKRAKGEKKEDMLMANRRKVVTRSVKDFYIENEVRNMVSISTWNKKYEGKSPQQLERSLHALKAAETRRKHLVEKILKVKPKKVKPIEKPKIEFYY